MREKCDSEILAAALNLSLKTKAVFCINTIFDWLYLTDILAGDPYQYRVNTPGTISEKNWSLRFTIAMEDLLKYNVTRKIRKMIEATERNAE